MLLSLSLWTSLSLVILLSSLSLSLSIISLPFPLPISLLAVYVARALDVRLAVIAVSCFVFPPSPSVCWWDLKMACQHPSCAVSIKKGAVNKLSDWHWET